MVARHFETLSQLLIKGENTYPTGLTNEPWNLTSYLTYIEYIPHFKNLGQGNKSFCNKYSNIYTIKNYILCQSHASLLLCASTPTAFPEFS